MLVHKSVYNVYVKVHIGEIVVEFQLRLSSYEEPKGS